MRERKSGQLMESLKERENLEKKRENLEAREMERSQGDIKVGNSGFQCSRRRFTINPLCDIKQVTFHLLPLP